eukprot:2475303-Amphidinium_carterae.2
MKTSAEDDLQSISQLEAESRSQELALSIVFPRATTPQTVLMKPSDSLWAQMMAGRFLTLPSQPYVAQVCDEWMAVSLSHQSPDHHHNNEANPNRCEVKQRPSGVAFGPDEVTKTVQDSNGQANNNFD